ncbi:MAG: hypothetical protein ACSHXF_16305 [Aquaticitalea sp.]
MKMYILLCMVGLLSVCCNGQKNEQQTEPSERYGQVIAQPKGSWKVDKEFDESGNLIRYDSIYSWSSNEKLNALSPFMRDRLDSLKSRFFTDFSDFETNGFDALFSKDSLFSSHYFNDDFSISNFGKDNMDIDKIAQQMMARQKAFLEKYQSAFIQPENEN